jgi:hypothetical protein
MTRGPRLAELRAEFRIRTVLDERDRIRPCFYAALPQVATKCDGPVRAYHFIKQQIIRRELKSRFVAAQRALAGTPLPAKYADVFLPIDAYQAESPIWMPEIAVPSCAYHDDCFDGNAMPPLTVYWEQIPEAVVGWAEDFSFMNVLERWCPREDASGEAA